MAKKENYELDYDEIAAHNARIQAEIEELEGKKKRYQAVIDHARLIIGSIDGLVTSCGDINRLLEQIIVGGDPVGHNVFINPVSTNLESYKETFNGIISECDAKMAEIDTKISALRSQMIDI